MSEAWASGGRSGRGAVDPATLAKLHVAEVPWRRIASMFAPHRFRLLGVFALSLVSAGLGLLPPLAIRRVIDIALPSRDPRMLVVLVGVLALAPLGAGLVGVAYDRMNNQVGQRVMRDLRIALFRAVQRQPVAFFTRTQAGELVQRLTGDVHFVQGVVTGTVVDAAIQVITLVVTAGILFALDWRLALACMVLVPLCALPIRAVTEARRRVRREAQEARGVMAALTTEAFGVSGALLTRIFAREEHVEKSFAAINQRVMDLELRFNVIGRWFGMVTAVLGPIGTAVLFLYGGLRVIHGQMTIGSVFAFSAYLGQLLGPAARLLNVHVEVSAAAAVFQRLFEVLDLEPALVEAPGAALMPNIEGRISFRAVSFSYDGERRALDDVSFEVEAGSVVALVGASGAGKSTLSALVARLADPDRGVVAVDGIDLRTVTFASLRRQIAFVPQDPFLFHTTLAENLRFAKLDASTEEMMAACRRARLDSVVAALPLGMETVVGERGHRFSGGERQRVAIARALLADPRVLVLDEATAHLDAVSELAVRDAVAELMRGRTTVVIAHRLSTILAADEIIVLDQGRVTERGTHQALLARCGSYAELVRTQLAPVQTSVRNEREAATEPAM
jgi:ATP-binding cassette subfamily B protein